MMNLPLAQEYLDGAHDLCDSDPLLLNELGVLAYHQDQSVHALSDESSSDHSTYRLDIPDLTAQ